jgi:hypothetical protein
LKGNGITGRVFQVLKVAIRAPEIYIWCLSGVVAGTLKSTNVWSYGNIPNQVTERSSSDPRAVTGAEVGYWLLLRLQNDLLEFDFIGSPVSSTLAQGVSSDPTYPVRMAAPSLMAVGLFRRAAGLWGYYRKFVLLPWLADISTSCTPRQPSVSPRGSGISARK